MKKRGICLLLIVFILVGCGAADTDMKELETGAMIQSDSISDTEVLAESETAESGAATEAFQNPTPEPTSQPIPQPTSMPAPEPETVSIIMVGDILLHTPVEEAALQEDGSYNFDAIFSNMKEEILEADLAIVNQEVVLGGEELGISGYPAFNAPYAVGDALVKAGFDVVCHGTNHALDKGRRGLLNCVSFWQENYPEVAVLGIHDSQESRDNIYVYEQGEISIAVLNYTYGTNGIPLPEDMPYAVDMLEEEQVVADIQRAEELADFTIVCPHWGTEYQLEKSAEQERWAEIFVENGVDLVLGTHPHVIQPIQWLVDDETGHEMLVYYSLGNFVNWTSGSGEGIANRMLGGMAQVTVTSQKGSVSITEYGIEPVVCHLERGVNGVTVYKLSKYSEELADNNQIRLQDELFSKKYCEQLTAEVWLDIMNDSAADLME